MASVNLLPEELRRLEQKEIKKISSHPKVTRIDLSAPDRPNVAGGADDRRPSWWQRIFGIESKPKQTNQTLKPTGPAPSGQSVDMIDSARRQRIEFDQSTAQTSAAAAKTAKIGKGSGKWRWPVGRHTAVAVSLSVEHDAPPAPAKWQAPTAGSGAGMATHHQAKELFTTAHNQDRVDHRAPRMAITPPSDSPIGQISWWDIVASLFFPKRHVRPSHLAHDRSAVANSQQAKPSPVVSASSPKELPKPTPQPVKPEKPAPASKSTKGSSEGQLAGHGFNINLIPEELLMHKHWGSAAYVIGGLVAVVLPIVLIGASYFIISQEQARFDQQIALSERNILELSRVLADYRSAQKSDDLWQDRLLAIDQLLKNHIYWSPFFTALEKYTLDGVQFGALQADTSGALILPATASDYDTAVRQIVAMRQATDFAAKVEVSAISLNTDKKQGATGVSFDLKLVLVDDIFTKKQ